jgi:3-oxoacyl-[acyl-carrier-protein] synthase-1
VSAAAPVSPSVSPSPSQPAAITGIGAVSPVGCTAAETAASLRAGICRFCEQERLYRPLTADPQWDRPEPLVASVVPGVPLPVAGAARLVELGARALRDLFRTAALRRGDVDRTGLFLALPEQDAVTAGWALDASVGAALWARLELPPLSVASVRAEGSAGSLAILADAAAALHAGRYDLAIVVGVDTFIDRDRLRHLDDDFRVKSARATAAMVPGEAAVALLLERPDAAARRGALALASIASVATANEPQIRAGDRESSGRGLTEALRRALRGNPAGAPRWVLCDLNGEAYRAIEWGVVRTRVARELGAIARLTHPADCLGDVGAATGGVLVGQALAGFARGYAPAREALLWAGAAGELRAAARIAAAAPAPAKTD